MVSWQALLLVAAIASNLFWATPLLRSSRPAVKSPGDQRSLGKQDVDARLWQDPFQAIGPQALKNAILTNDAAHDAQDLVRQIGKRGSPRLTILPVMITGSPYAEDSEWRLRSRYAVISALNVCNYVPEDSQHIGFIRVPWPVEVSEGSQVTNGPSLVVPYEWFTWTDLHSPYPPTDRSAADDVLVLWLRDELFSDQPLLRLGGLVSLLDPAVTNASGTAQANIAIRIMGPYGSTTLRTMYFDAEQGNCSAATSNTLSLAGTRIYSASATAADAFVVSHKVLSPEQDGLGRREKVRQALLKAGVEFINCTCTDQDLAKALIEELGRRQLCLSDSRDGIVMISEEDTFYGRSLPATFEMELRKYRPANEAWPSEWGVKHYTYLRGLDGQAASGDAPTEKASSADKKAEATPGRPSGLERPENSGQLDYVRRMVERIQRDCSAQTNSGPFVRKAPRLKAIGIVGSDVYDKLLLLQLLRKQFPEVLFFTTDLDARLFHPQELKSSRNVLLASTFGLELAPALQHDIPPFRDTYQTALFLGTCVALGAVSPDKLSHLEPRVFEIGQLGAVDLSVTEGSLYPRRDNYGRWKNSWQLDLAVGVLLVLAVVLVNLVLPVRQRFHLDRSNQYFGSWLLSSFGLLALAAFGLSLYADYNNSAGEPVLFLSGVSLWPTEIVRFITACCCFFWLLVTAQKLGKDKADLARDFGFPTTLLEKLGNRRWWEKFRLASWAAREADGGKIETISRDKRVCAGRLWQDYSYLGSSRNRLYRVLVASIVFVGFGLIVVFANPPFFPGRGKLSYLVDRAMMSVLVTGFILLMFVVVDATRLCTRLVENLTVSPTNWNAIAYRKFQKACPIPRAYLSDWIGIKFVAQRTRMIVRLIYYPFIIIFLMMISRAHFFDAWDWPWGLQLVVGLSAAFAFCCAASLRITAEKARKEALGRMREKLVLLRAGNVTTDEAPVATSKEPKLEPQTESPEAKSEKSEPEKHHGILIGRKELEVEFKELIDEVKNTEEGAFAPWSRQPLVGALIMPFTGAGLVAWLQYLANSR